MKNRWISLLLAILIIHSPLAQVNAAVVPTGEKNSHYALLDENGQAILPGVSPICWASEGDLYFLGSGYNPSLFRRSPGQSKVELIKDNPLDSQKNWKGLHQLGHNGSNTPFVVFALSDGLYTLYVGTGEILCYDMQTDEWAHISSLVDEKGNALLANAEMIKDIAWDATCIYFLVHASEGTSLVQLDVSAGVHKILPDTSFAQIEPYQSDMLLVNLEGSIHGYNPHTQTIGEAFATADSTSSAFAYDQASDCLLFIHNGDIYQKTKDHPADLIRVTEVGNQNPTGSEGAVYENSSVSFLLPMVNGMLTYQISKDDFMYVVCRTPIDKEIETLHISNHFLVANAFFQLTHPNIRIEHCIVGNDADHLPDVFSRFTRVNESRQLMDLSESSIINEIVNQYDSKILDEICDDGKIIGLPWSISLNTLEYEKEKWDAIGLPDPPKTVDELFALIELWDDEYADQYPDQPLLGNGGFFDSRYGVWAAVTEAYASAYASSNAPVNFNTQEYHMLLQRIMDMPDVQYDEWDVLLRFFMAFSPLHYAFPQLDWKNGYPEFSSIPPLKLSQMQPLRIHADMSYVCIAEDAQSPDLALEYVSFLAEFQHVYQPEIAFMMTGGEDQPLDISAHSASFPPLLFVGMTKDGLATLPGESPDGFISNASVDFYRAAFSSLDFHTPWTNPALWNDPDEMRLPWPNDYYPNDAALCTVDELIAEMNRASERIFGT